jgi:hypothetical protein
MKTEKGPAQAGTHKAEKGAWVQIHRRVLDPEERSGRLPRETRDVPLEMWLNGFLLEATAEIGDEVEIETAIGRRERGTLNLVNPGYSHSFGTTVPELLHIRAALRDIVRDMDDE